MTLLHGGTKARKKNSMDYLRKETWRLQRELNSCINNEELIPVKKKMNNEDHLLKVKIVETCKLITETFQVNNVPLNVGVAALMAVLFITIEKTKNQKATFDQLYQETRQLFEEIMSLDESKKKNS